MTKPIYLLLGFGFVAVAALGFVLPILPGTPFLLLAAGCFARSSERWHQWLLHSQLFGPLIKNWERNQCISLRTKWVALASMLGAGGSSIMFALESAPAQIMTAGLLIAGATTVLSIQTCDKR